MTTQVQLTGQMTVRFGHEFLRSSEMGGSLGRLVIVRLSLASGPISRDSLVDSLWGDDPPNAFESVLNATCSRLRRGLNNLGLDGRKILLSSQGSAEIKWPSGTNVDVEIATRSVEQAAVALERGDISTALRRATVGFAVSRRELLPGLDKLWIDDVRNRLRLVHERSLGVLADAWHFRADEFSSWIAAREFVRVSPYSQQAVEKLVRAQCALGNIGAAHAEVQAFERRLHEDLGIDQVTGLREWISELAARHSPVEVDRRG